MSGMKQGTLPENLQAQKNNKGINQQILYPQFNNLHEIDQFLQRNSLPKLKQEEVDNLNRLISIKEIG